VHHGGAVKQKKELPGSTSLFLGLGLLTKHLISGFALQKQTKK
jgi:hypothetical protein